MSGELESVESSVWGVVGGIAFRGKGEGAHGGAEPMSGSVSTAEGVNKPGHATFEDVGVVPVDASMDVAITPVIGSKAVKLLKALTSDCSPGTLVCSDVEGAFIENSK